MAIETTYLSETVRVSVQYDMDPANPLQDEDLVTVAYLSGSRHLLGNEPMTRDEMEQLEARIRKGELVGWPVYAYIHGQVHLSVGNENPYHCRWDSGKCGFAYMTKENAILHFGRKNLSPSARLKAYKYVEGVIKDFTQYLCGEMYGFEIETKVDGEWEVETSCWGFFSIDDAMVEGCHDAEQYLEDSHA